MDQKIRPGGWLLNSHAAARPGRFHGIKLSRDHQGHQSALLAGLRHTPGDCLISIDADLQDDVEAITEMIRFFCEGFDIVYGVRKGRESDFLVV